MSAYIVGREHIRYLVSAAMSRRMNPCGGSFSWVFNVDRRAGTYKRGELPSGDRDRATAVGQMLWDENVRSVEGRYPDTQGRPEAMPGPGESMYIYAHSYSGFDTFDPVQVLKACDCYAYQSCEHAEWETSEARAFIESLRKSAWRALPGYEEAEWGPPRPKANPA